MVSNSGEKGTDMKEKTDMHGHYFPPAYRHILERHGGNVLDGAPIPAWSEELQFQLMEELNIRCSVLSLSSPHFHFGDREETVQTARLCNEYGAELKTKYPERFRIMASLPFPYIEECLEEIRYCTDTLKTDGFALQTHFCGDYLGSERMEPVMQSLNRIKAAVVLHPTVPAKVPENVNDGLPAALLEYFFDTTRAVTNMILRGTLRKYQDIRFIVPHAGAFLTLLSDRLDVLGGALHMKDLDVMGDLRRLYYDIAGVSMPKQFGLLEKITDESHILYGSDSPFTPLKLCRKWAIEMEEVFGREKSGQIFRDNAEILFRR
jgi:predicted TIM-barrel fold metal-dependent hydrolase